jgi:hypothetical protein
LAWLEDKKAQILNQRWKTMQASSAVDSVGGSSMNVDNAYRQELTNQLEQAAGTWSGELGEYKIIKFVFRLCSNFMTFYIIDN